MVSSHTHIHLTMPYSFSETKQNKKYIKITFNITK